MKFMKSIIIVLLAFASFKCIAQKDTTKHIYYYEWSYSDRWITMEVGRG